MTLTRTRIPVPSAPARHVRPRRPLPPAVPVAAALLLLHLLVLVGAPAAPRVAVGLPLVTLLPGTLLLKALRVRRRGADLLLCTIAGSLAVLLATATVLALAGRLSPLDCLIGLDVAMALPAVAAVVRHRRDVGADRRHRHLGRAGAGGPGSGVALHGRGVSGHSGAVLDPVISAGRPRDTGLRASPTASFAGAAGAGAGLTLLAGSAGVALAVAGAARLNAGGGPGLTVAAFTAVLVAVAGAAHAARHHRPGVAAAALYLAGLAVLLATSLRGTGVTGHDIKIEYHVLMDVLETGRWRPGGAYPGYNSCLSLTTLPAFLARLLGLAPLDVYRVAYQLIFAVAPVGVFVIARRLVPPVAAVLAAGLFIAFPTFVNDMPMLNRQEIALIFFLVLLLGLLDARGPRGPRIALLLIAAAGLTVSHYSSTAVAAALLGVAAVLRLIRRRLPSMKDGVRRPPGLAGPAGVLATMLVGWALCTGSAAAFAADVAQTGRAIGAQAMVLSDSTRYLRPGDDAPDDATALKSYLDTVRGERGLPDPGCPPATLPADELPPTALGDVIRAPHAVNTLLRQAFVLLFMAGAAAGCAVLWWRARHPARPSVRVLAETGTAALVLLGVAVVAPQITDSYGLLRLYQQFLPLLGPAVLLALTVVARGRPARWVLTALVVAALATTSGLVPRLTGGYPPQLNLAASGSYYRAWYATAADARDAARVEAALPPGVPLLADSRDAAVLRAYTELRPLEGVGPGTVWPDSYLVVRDGGATAVIGERVVRYTFPLSCLTAGRTLLVDAGDLHVYGPDRREPR
jgi:hypothetical protein